MNRIFVSSLGAPSRGYHEEKYSLGDKSARSRFAPAALAQLLDLRGWNAVVLVTPKALENHYDSLSAELASLGLQPRHAQISESLRPDDIQSILETINQIVPDAARVVLDITYGFRHLPMIHLVSLAYLVPLKQVEVQGIYYGAREAGGAFVNLSGLFDVIRWAHAIEAFREIGDLRLVAARLRETVSRQARAGRTDPAAQAAQSEAERFSRFLSAGLPLEVGLSARELDSRIQALSPDTAPRLVRRTLDALEPLLKPWIIKGDHSEKKDVALDREELLRELRLVEWWVEKGDLPKALSVLREWIVNAAAQAAGLGHAWLDYDTARKPVEARLHELAESARQRQASDTERELASLWAQVSNARNLAMHAGFSPYSADVSREKIRASVERCREMLRTGGFRCAAPIRAEPPPASGSDRFLERGDGG